MSGISYVVVIPEQQFSAYPFVAIGDDAARERARKILTANDAQVGILYRCDGDPEDPLFRLGKVCLDDAQ